MPSKLLAVILASLLVLTAVTTIIGRATEPVTAQSDTAVQVDLGVASAWRVQLSAAGETLAVGTFTDTTEQVQVIDRRTGERTTVDGALVALSPDGSRVLTEELTTAGGTVLETIRLHDLGTGRTERLLTGQLLEAFVLSDGRILLGSDSPKRWQLRDNGASTLLPEYDGRLTGAGPAGSVAGLPTGAGASELLDPETLEPIADPAALYRADPAFRGSARIDSSPADERLDMTDRISGETTSVSLREVRPASFFATAIRGSDDWDVIVRRQVDRDIQLVSVDPRTLAIDVLASGLDANVQPFGWPTGDWGYIDRGDLYLTPLDAAPPPTTTPSTTVPPEPVASGYWLLDRDGGLYEFGDAGVFGGINSAPAVAIESTATGDGAWILTEDGVVHTRGAASHRGDVDLSILEPGERVAALSARPTGLGYWVFTDLGRAIPFGDGQFFGEMLGTPLNGPIVASRATPSGLGYWMVGSDAQFFGSMGGIPLNQPVVGIAPDPDGVGYWLVASDGGIFAFDAEFLGSMGATPLNAPVVGAISRGNGYLLLGSDGGVFNFSDQPFAGSLGASPPSAPVIGVAAFSG